MIDLGASIVASTISTAILYPAERVKIQMQLQISSTNFSETIKLIMKNNGVSGFYTGISSLMIGNGISYGVYFVVY